MYIYIWSRGTSDAGNALGCTGLLNFSIMIALRNAEEPLVWYDHMGALGWGPDMTDSGWRAGVTGVCGCSLMVRIRQRVVAMTITQRPMTRAASLDYKRTAICGTLSDSKSSNIHPKQWVSSTNHKTGARIWVLLWNYLFEKTKKLNHIWRAF